ncbi:PTS mannose transporter subunit IIA [Virgibacillus pantothenticus]|uniref:PTS system cellobiose-specific transporter subunit IIA n=1 Tax=Virgibacillus pantothenticus TaxID=1473 RepID=A0A0L0QME5_VIRPA|nr:PTS lactose/cellobiose transporter subunit IIA [Virgibacillus pantothenticus]KNE19433.1 PTS system cellobiose-specific transporter subunit IIA [Virgibacillus pantothenticus]MED3737135.1 PTS lactose/cellobiose transporter subunit IIA [Virgibacillus pantothenticus]QTY15045.1 PTS lactose/cellobiose transporter subunit IIA [Virgibacillus pantothenticus]SIT13179.1 PTS system, cellobiose-specific IIA component [Virgibacillus pantothenticus]GIP62743.1 PTS mannose transporter subunit IIA [Virgibaci
MDIENVSMNIILRASNAKKHLYEALNYAREAEFSQIESTMKHVSDELLEAHKLQTKLIQEDTQGGLENLSVLLIHAQDHLMSVISEKSLVGEMIEIYCKQSEISKKVDYLMTRMIDGS